MPKVWVEAKFRGEAGEISALALANSGAEHTVLTEQILAKIQPKFTGDWMEIQVASGERHYSPVYLVEIEIPKAHRSCQAQAVMLPGRNYPLLGISALEKLRAVLDLELGKIEFK